MGVSLDPAGLPLVLGPDSGGISDWGTSVLSPFLWLMVLFGGIFYKRVTLELEKNFIELNSIARTQNMKEVKQFLMSYSLLFIKCGAQHTHKQDSTRHGFIDSLGLLNSVL